MSDTNEIKVPKRILNNLLASLAAGVVPRVGAPYIAIGRTAEIKALLESLATVADGGAAVRFLIGRYGSGKSFLLQLIRGYALERNFLCADVDLSADQRRLCGGNGAGLATYRELLRNLASKASPDGGALPVVLSRHYALLLSELAAEGVLAEDEGFRAALRKKIHASFSALEGGVGGFDFARVVCEYFFALADEDDEKKSACLRWLRGEFSTKTEAKNALRFPISCLIDDENWYDFIKLWATLSRRLGYAGLIVYVDECIVLYKIVNRVARENNYEKLLTIFNDTLQGRAEGLGVIFGGTPQFLEDTRRGLFSYEALRSRLADSRFSEMGYATYSSPIIRLRRLSDNELYALLSRLSKLYAQAYGTAGRVSDEDMRAFLENALARAGADELLTPREIIRDYMTVLHVLRDNPDVPMTALLSGKTAAAGAEKPASEDFGADGAGITLSDFEF